MSKSRLGESLLKTIEGGKRDNPEFDAEQKADEFELARSTGSDIEFGEKPALNESSNGDDDLEEDIQHEPVVSLHADKKDSPQEYPSRVQIKKSKNSISRIGVLALLISLISISIGGYSVLSQKKLIANNEVSRDSIDQAIGSLTTKADELSVVLSVATKDIALNKENISSMDLVRADIEELKVGLELIRSQVGEMKHGMEINTKSIGEQQLIIESNKESLEMLANKVTIQRQPVRKVPHLQNSSTTTSAFLEGARVASIDTWGSESSVMLRDNIGNWVPLSDGDYFRGWRLEGTEDGIAVFKRGDKTTRLIVED